MNQVSQVNDFKQWYNGLDARERKVFYFALAAVVVLLFLWMPSPASLLPHFGGRERPAIQKPLPGRIVAPAAPVVAATPQPMPSTPSEAAQSPVGDLLGKWVGRGQRIADRGLCNFSLEVKAVPGQLGKYTGASGLACAPLTAVQAANAGPGLTMHVPNSGALDLVLDHMIHTLSTLSGVQEGDFIKLHVDETVRAPATCVMTDLEVKPFQTGTVLVKWTAPGCAEVSMMLQKAR